MAINPSNEGGATEEKRDISSVKVPAKDPKKKDDKNNNEDDDLHEVHRIPTKKAVAEIPTPRYDIVDTYERDYLCTFNQPNSYLGGCGARSELGEFVEYDLDNEDEDWYEEEYIENEAKKNKNLLTPEEFEGVLFRLEVMDHKTRERAGVITPTLSLPIPVLLQMDAAFEVMQFESISYSVFQSIFRYWRDKRERWQKPILRRLQPPPPVMLHYIYIMDNGKTSPLISSRILHFKPIFLITRVPESFTL
ncbi:hypothetical protein IFM89_009535 [Coptis chinensis]|uniref:Enhancer of polycomb-like protein n=1 Tax=Coptis chinensis TaxID=261450 RepID=A0A835HSW1_9MAGN|nr:hypothetical protein IFM89_009535 [Coptis chinensis]